MIAEEQEANMRLLLKHGTDIDGVNQDGQTALQLAVEYKFYSLASLTREWKAAKRSSPSV